ncbi:MAG TPA: response regulator transcription factor, partial [Saprospiraceae bacterium]|nr:response regulator transcription factor [Saprospiraceae bacterium]
PRVFISRIKALLRRSERTDAPAEQELINIGDLVIDSDRVTVTRGEEVIELAKKEFELLYLLVSKPGKVFSREEIFNKVWGTDVIVGNRTIDVHIRKLREKIGDHYIKTIKGIGYKFEF